MMLLLQNSAPEPVRKTVINHRFRTWPLAVRNETLDSLVASGDGRRRNSFRNETSAHYLP